MSETERLLRSVVKRRSEIELIFRTTTSENKKSNCLILMDALTARQSYLEKTLEKESTEKKPVKPWYSIWFNKNSY